LQWAEFNKIKRQIKVGEDQRFQPKRDHKLSQHKFSLYIAIIIFSKVFFLSAASLAFLDNPAKNQNDPENWGCSFRTKTRSHPTFATINDATTI